ncbi:MAG: hypothetical protein HN564_06690, partial [Flavobacteriales bacterium]|nr:hypothetical protein [Flavobacteriales bacterium]
MTTETTNINIDLIDPDKNNPRIAEYILENPNPKKSTIFRMLGSAEPDRKSDSTNYNSLKNSIKANGTLINRVLLGKYDERYRVIEGNTRLAIYNELYQETKDNRWKSIPAEIDNNIDEIGEHKIRLQAHLVGVREWSPFAKGKYLYELVNENKMTLDEVAGICGDQRNKISLLIKAYEDFKEYYMPMAKDDMNPQRFSAFVEIQNPRRKQLLINQKFSMDDFAQWNNPHNLKITKNEHVRKLDQILSNPEAKSIFLKIDSEEAIKFLMQENPDLTKYSLVELADEVNLRVGKFDMGKITKFQNQEDDKDPTILSIVDLRDTIENFL